MAKEWAKPFYRSKAWQSCRKAYIAKRIRLDGGLCERCKDRPGFIVHHKIYLTPVNIQDPDIALNHCYLEYVCKACHDDEHYSDMHGVQPSISFDAAGQIIPRER